MTPIAKMPSRSNSRMVWSIRVLRGTQNATRLPLSSALETICALVSVLPAPVGICSMGRLWLDSSD